LHEDAAFPIPTHRHGDPMQPTMANGLAPADHRQGLVMLVNTLDHLIHEPYKWAAAARPQRRMPAAD
jgi:hypothetical protein